MDRKKIKDFLFESNWIEGISEVRSEEVETAIEFLALDQIKIADLVKYVNVTANAKLRIHGGMDVMVGNHFPPRGGPGVGYALEALLTKVNNGEISPYEAHQEYETLHPFTDGNGRSGRLLWAWQMLREDRWPGIDLRFLHAWYYQSLENGRS